MIDKPTVDEVLESKPAGAVVTLTMASDDHGIEPGLVYADASGRHYLALNTSGNKVLALLGDPVAS